MSKKPTTATERQTGASARRLVQNDIRTTMRIIIREAVSKLIEEIEKHYVTLNDEMYTIDVLPFLKREIECEIEFLNEKTNMYKKIKARIKADEEKEEKI